MGFNDDVTVKAYKLRRLQTSEKAFGRKSDRLRSMILSANLDGTLQFGFKKTVMAIMKKIYILPKKNYRKILILLGVCDII